MTALHGCAAASHHWPLAIVLSVLIVSIAAVRIAHHWRNR